LLSHLEWDFAVLVFICDATSYGPRHVVTVHGPLNPVVPPEAGVRETRAVLERTRTDTKMAIADGRLALIAVITLPLTALSSVYGKNIIANDRTDFPHLAGALAVMAAMSASLLRWVKWHRW
jgi:hypothetical protein